MIKNCTNCNKDFSKPYTVSLKKWGKTQFCSASCRMASYPEKVELSCLTCQKNFKVISSRETRSKFCSKECMSKSYPPKKTLVCMECEGYFTVRNYLKDRTYFCSHTCSSQYRNEGKTPKNKILRQTAAYKAWRTLIFERDNYTCVSCDVRGGQLHADHIKPFALYPELRLDTTNGRTLCVPCHRKTDTWGRGQVFRKSCMATGSTV